MAIYKSIIVPVDLAEVDFAHPALEAAVALAKASGGTVKLLSVIQVLPALMAEYLPVGFENEQVRKAREALQDVTKDVDLPPDRVSAEVRIGGVYHEVVEAARDDGADLIVMCSHRPAMSTYLIGSNAASIVRHAPCSVLVVRA